MKVIIYYTIVHTSSTTIIIFPNETTRRWHCFKSGIFVKIRQSKKTVVNHDFVSSFFGEL